MKKIEAIIRPLRLEPVKTALAEAGLSGMTASDVRGSGRPDNGRTDSGRTGNFRSEQYVMHLPPKVKLELVVQDEAVAEFIEIILEQARTGEEGDGKIFVLPAGDARRIRTGETGNSVL